MSLAESALAEVLSWRPAELLAALREPARHLLDAEELERIAAMRGTGFAAGLLIERAYQEQGWKTAAAALLQATLAALAHEEAPPMAYAFLQSARSHLGQEGMKWESIELYARAAHDETQPPLIQAAARVALTATHLAGEPAPGDVARAALEILFEALPPDRRLLWLCWALASLEKGLRDVEVGPEELLDLAMRGGSIGEEARWLGLPRSLAEARTWGPAQVLRALRLELKVGRRWSEEDLEQWAALDGADFAAGLLLAQVEREHPRERAEDLLRAAHGFVFRELGVSLREQELATEVTEAAGVEHAGRTLVRGLVRVQGGEALVVPLLAHLEARAEALSGNGGAGSPILH